MLVCSAVGWLVGRLARWLVSWLINWLVDWVASWLLYDLCMFMHHPFVNLKLGMIVLKCHRGENFKRGFPGKYLSWAWFFWRPLHEGDFEKKNYSLYRNVKFMKLFFHDFFLNHDISDWNLMFRKIFPTITFLKKKWHFSKKKSWLWKTILIENLINVHQPWHYEKKNVMAYKNEK